MEEKRYCVVNSNKRCVVSSIKNETSAQCRFVGMKCSRKKRDYELLFGFPIMKSAKNYINKIIMKRDANELRAKAPPYFPVNEFQNDKQMKEYIVKELLKKASSETNQIITVNHIHTAIDYSDHDSMDMVWIVN